MSFVNGFLSSLFAANQMSASEKENRRRHFVYDRARDEIVKTLCHFFADPTKMGYLKCLSMHQISLLLATEIKGITLQSLQIISGRCTSTLDVSQNVETDDGDEVDDDVSEAAVLTDSERPPPPSSEILSDPIGSTRVQKDATEQTERRRRRRRRKPTLQREDLAPHQLDCIVRTLRHSLEGWYGDGDDVVLMLTCGVKVLEGLARSAGCDKNALVAAGSIEALMEIVAMEDPSHNKPKEASSLISLVGDAVSFGSSSSSRSPNVNLNLQTNAAKALKFLVVDGPLYYDRVCAWDGGHGAARLLEVLSRDQVLCCPSYHFSF
jgi:hypothetical protein